MRREAGAQLRVIVVENDFIVARHLERVVRQSGHQLVAGVASARGALVAVDREPVDLALVDLRLGFDMNGLELSRRLGESRGVAVGFVSGHPNEEVEAELSEPYVVGFVSKPFTDHQIQALLERASARSARSLRETRASDRPGPPSDAMDSADPIAALRRLSAAVAELDIGGNRNLGEEGTPVSEEGALADLIGSLSEREWEVLRGLIAHRRVAGIAKTLHISQHTVRNHLKSIYIKLDVSSQEELLELLIRS